ncbi:UDP-N-acetylmuramoyl-L-alanine--D-glutamate ligase [Clostridium bornimense]|uniref:UDP-N-acetylmuramoyl-L-alanine--D-glutamate ligase n=1 Tax=Clostridium bornimense TaxID=1216932 RepID=UPI001C102A47|nr:UDP-N-acetylmuramoyl-L-alanine--D-glutamate ligase [Clostridium bornimense]MBU5315628.1 UDP-N-acetylmuramoyl-L-alanine--D-glutamate ligase [Clostridium bornimense]
MREDFSKFKEFIKNKNVAVVGIGVSNVPLIRFLVSLGAKVSAFDRKSREALGEVGNEFETLGVKLILGEGYLDKLTGFEVIFKTPSMRIDCDALVKAKEEGAYITSEMEEFIRYCKGTIFAVTGSDGKTTSTTLIYNMLKEEGYKTYVGGNIGTPLFAKIEEINEEDKVVLELSSFQLMTIKLPMDVVVVTNITPNHLDMHKGMEEYIEAKKNIFKYQDNSGLLILNMDNDITASFVGEEKGRLNKFSAKQIIDNGAYYKDGSLYVNNKKVCDKDEIVIKGMHNVENYLGAFCAVYDYVSIDTMRKVATTFKGVEHRCELVREINGVKYYNDSIASSPTRTLAGLKAFDHPVILIAGGYDKNIPFEPLAEEGYEKVKALILLGKTKEKINKVFQDVIKEKNISLTIYMVNTMEEAVLKAKEISKAGDIVTLSPACASFDMYPNFEVRGRAYKDIVKKL